MYTQVLASSQNFTGYAIGTVVVFGYSFLLASFVLFLVNEMESKVCISTVHMYQSVGRRSI